MLHGAPPFVDDDVQRLLGRIASTSEPTPSLPSHCATSVRKTRFRLFVVCAFRDNPEKCRMSNFGRLVGGARVRRGAAAQDAVGATGLSARRRRRSRCAHGSRNCVFYRLMLVRGRFANRMDDRIVRRAEEGEGVRLHAWLASETWRGTKCASNDGRHMRVAMRVPVRGHFFLDRLHKQCS